MNYKACFFACLLLISGNIFGITKEFLQEITLALKDQDGNSVSSPLAVTTIKPSELYNFRVKRIVFSLEREREIKFFNMLGNCLKTIHVEEMINSSDAMQEYVVIGYCNGKIQLFNQISGKSITWKAYDACDIFSSIFLPVWGKMGKVDGKMCVISGSWDACHGLYENYEKDGAIKIWDINESNDGTLTVNCKKEIACSSHVGNIGVIPTINEKLDIYSQLSKCKIALFDWDKEIEKYSIVIDDPTMTTFIEHDSFIVTKGGPGLSPKISVLELKKKEVLMEYSFSEKTFGEIGFIESIISIPKTDFLCIFFQYGSVVFFDWKKKEIIDKFSMGQKKIKAGALMSSDGKLYTVVGLEGGTVKVALVGVENGTIKVSEVMSGKDEEFVGNNDFCLHPF